MLLFRIVYKAVLLADGSRDPQLRGSKARRAPRQLPSGVAKDADVLDVWFESKEQQKERRRR